MGFIEDAAAEFGLGKEFGLGNSALLADGTIARGTMVSVTPTGIYRGGEADQSPQAAVCTIVVDVQPLDGSTPYRATTTQAIPETSLPRLQDVGTAVAVRIDPSDKTRVVIALTDDTPDAPASTLDPNGSVLTDNDGNPRSAQPAPTTGTVLAKGTPCTVDLVLVYPIGQDDSTGHPASGLMMTVHRSGSPDFRAQVGVFVPDDKAAKVVVGATLPARWLHTESDDVVVPDWSKI